MKQKIKIAARRPTPKNMSRTHYTTLGFGVPYPIFCEETINKDKFNIRVQNFSRLAPMLLPNLGTLEMKLHAFYVPFRLVWNHFENFREGLPSWNARGSWVYKNVPKISDLSLSNYFVNSIDTYTPLLEVVDNTSKPFDIQLFTNSSTYTLYKFTQFGKEVYHTLLALGYNFKFINSYDQDSVNVEYSALPLLCYFKIFLDYFIPSQLQPSSAIHRILCVVHDMTSEQILSDLDMELFFAPFSEIRLYYQNNYFTSAWLSPNAPVSGLNNIGSSQYDRPVINSVSSQVSVSISSPVNQQLYSNDNYIARTNSPSPQVSGTTVSSANSALTADGITFMQKFAAFIKRSNFAGSRSVERLLARFGVHVDDFQVGLCKYLGSETLELQKSDVTVTGNTEQAGEFVGKGFFSGGSQRTFKCQCDYAGMIFVTASLQTPSTYLNGVRRRNLHLKPLDFYTPEFDGSLMQAISGCEIENRFITNSSDLLDSVESLGLNYSNVYGFSPRFSEYAVPLDDISGDFAIGRLSQNIDPFILPRRLYDQGAVFNFIQGGNAEELDLHDFVYNPAYSDDSVTVNPINDLYTNDAWQFNRIFKDITGDSDPVFSVFRINCVVNSVKLPLNESAEIIGRGSEIEFETNGVHLS